MNKVLHVPSSLSTDRLHLNLLTVEDHDFIFSLVNSKGWIEFIGDKNVHSQDDAIAYIQKILSNEAIAYWVVTVKDTNVPTGLITLIKRTYLDHYDIGFAFLPDYQGSGYAHEAAQAVLSMAATIPLFNPMLATLLPSNTKSIKLLHKLGLRFDKEIEVEQVKLHLYTNAPLS